MVLPKDLFCLNTASRPILLSCACFTGRATLDTAVWRHGKWPAGRAYFPPYFLLSFYVTFFIFLLSAHIGISWKELEMKTNKVSRVMSLVASGFEPGPIQLEIEK